MNKLLARLTSVFKRQPSDRVRQSAIDVGTTDATVDFQPVNELESLLMRAAKDPSWRRQFAQALLENELFAATPTTPSHTQPHIFQPGEKLAILSATGGSGRRAPAIFTSEGRIVRAFGPGAGFIRVNGKALLELVANDGAVLNPGSDYGVEWMASDIVALLGKPVRRTIEKETQVLLGVPSERPEDLIAHLRTSFENDPKVEEAWLALAHWPESNSRSWYLDIRSDAPRDEINATLSGALSKTASLKYPVDVVVTPPDSSSGQGIRIKPVETH
ncbi:MAG: enhanced serine sensitivity protein SseB C-terminal domain-containing protein [Mesorhizobium sp.]|uniref:enhanced serine sensitivity protein SseB C-terminal domain-containing protein n=1 Tax=Mesorhizobium sp. TaxID=1871066 RepID=UPI001AD4E3E4|nr:enhanced serine sensitivity protein SseB C-terminal domain-containing protein [Mesorhizobium sp.]MBN9221391.1 enhanced serine sensitivity protein SseB C-terminal domain-containing protein [Mesorhizobium sp.]